MPRPQFTLRALLVAMLVVGAFFGAIVCAGGKLASLLLMVWGAFAAGCIGAMWSRAHAILAAFFAFFFLWPIWLIVTGVLD